MDTLILVICIISLIISVGCLIVAISLFKSIKDLRETGVTDKKLDDIKESVYNEFSRNRTEQNQLGQTQRTEMSAKMADIEKSLKR